MNCPQCGGGFTRVVHVNKFETVNIRTRKCLNNVCACIFLTEEIMQVHNYKANVKTRSKRQ